MIAILALLLLGKKAGELMIVAVPVCRRDIAPAFWFAEGFLIAEIFFEKTVSMHLVETSAKGWVTPLEELSDRGVEIILCDAFNRSFIPFAEELGIHVITGMEGEARQAIEAFADASTMRGQT